MCPSSPGIKRINSCPAAPFGPLMDAAILAAMAAAADVASSGLPAFGVRGLASGVASSHFRLRSSVLMLCVIKYEE